jgi:hypothetical protein
MYPKYGNTKKKKKCPGKPEHEVQRKELQNTHDLKVQVWSKEALFKTQSFWKTAKEKNG